MLFSDQLIQFFPERHEMIGGFGIGMEGNRTKVFFHQSLAAVASLLLFQKLQSAVIGERLTKHHLTHRGQRGAIVIRINKVGSAAAVAEAAGIEAGVVDAVAHHIVVIVQPPM